MYITEHYVLYEKTHSERLAQIKKIYNLSIDSGATEGEKQSANRHLDILLKKEKMTREELEEKLKKQSGEPSGGFSTGGPRSNMGGGKSQQWMIQLFQFLNRHNIKDPMMFIIVIYQVGVMFFSELILKKLLKNDLKSIALRSKNINRKLTDKFNDLTNENIVIKNIKGLWEEEQTYVVYVKSIKTMMIPAKKSKLTENEQIALCLSEYYFQDSLGLKASSFLVNTVSTLSIGLLEYFLISKDTSKLKLESNKIIASFILSFLNRLFSNKLQSVVEKLLKSKLKKLNELGYKKYYLSAIAKNGDHLVNKMNSKLKKKNITQDQVEKASETFKIIDSKHLKTITTKVFNKVKKNKR